jgi:hypothetical protein
MSKSTVTKLFLGSLIGAVAGAIVMLGAVATAFANDVFVMSGQDVVGIRGGGMAWSLIAVAAIGGLTIAAAAIGGLVSWIGALLNTSQLESKTWFIVLLLLGIFNIGVLAMIAYVIAGPDGTAQRRSLNAPASAGA